MLTNKQIKLLTYLNEQILSCTKCDLYKTGRCGTYWTSKSKYIALGEAPGKNEVDSKEPFIGATGQHLWHIANKHNLFKENFAIINTVQCRPMDNGKNGKPTVKQQEACFPWIRKLIKIIQPKKGIIFGNYAMRVFTGKSSGITQINSSVQQITIENIYTIPFILSVHPAVCIYNGQDGKNMINESMRNFIDV